MSKHGNLPIQRKHNKYIMQVALDSNRFSDTELIYIDRCQKYLQILTISDISTPCGIYIDGDKLFGTPTNFSSRSQLHHFNQERPPSWQWKPWRKLMDTLTDPYNGLHQNFGPFTFQFHDIRTQWPVVGYDPTTDNIYTCRDDTVQELRQFTESPVYTK